MKKHDIEEIILCDKNMQCNDIGLIKSYKARISCLIYTNQGINETIKKTNGDYCLALFCGDCLAHAFSIEQMQRIKRYGLTNKLVWCIERGLFKWEKHKLKRQSF